MHGKRKGGEDEFDLYGNSIINNQFNFPNIRTFEYNADYYYYEHFDISKLASCEHLATLTINAFVRLINNQPRADEFKNLKEIHLSRYICAADEFIGSLDKSVVRNISYELNELDAILE